MHPTTVEFLARDHIRDLRLNLREQDARSSRREAPPTALDVLIIAGVRRIAVARYAFQWIATRRAGRQRTRVAQP